MANLSPLAMVVLGGVALAIQAPMNAALARNLGATLPAAVVSFAIGLAVLVALSLFTGTANFAPLTQVPLWQLAGGFLGAYYVWAVAWGVPSLGVVSTVAALILGQMVAGLYLDSIGAFGLTVQAITAKRLAAAGLVAAGLALSRL
jgi:bacterial/archaeal transporter family-2 protein